MNEEQFYNYADAKSDERPRTRRDWEKYVVREGQGTMNLHDEREPHAPAVVESWIQNGYLVPA
jgi:hypothetical protein